MVSKPPARSAAGEVERVEVRSRAAWRAWLGANGRQVQSIWLVTFKKDHVQPGDEYIGYDALVEEAICFGWIDSRVARLDAARTMLLMSPRRAGSRWSAANKARVAKMRAAGLMAAPGEAAVVRAEADGTWTALDGVERLEVPADLATALEANAKAKAAWEGFSRSSRRGILEWLLSAKRPQTRAARVTEIVAMASKGLRANFPQDRRRAGA
jgi:uncharacterized protein YdeI (YjbR/CyaY-like superfamily)